MSSLAVKPCRDCGTPIMWLKHALTGNPAPIEASPDRTGYGNVVIDIDRETYVIKPPGAKAEGRPLHNNHRATCQKRPEVAES